MLGVVRAAALSPLIIIMRQSGHENELALRTRGDVLILTICNSMIVNHTRSNLEHQNTVVIDILRSDRRYKRMGVKPTRGETRLAILDIVRNALIHKSYEKLSMEEVAATASVTRRTLYNLFADKSDLYRSACERALKAVTDNLPEEIPERMSPPDGLRFFADVCRSAFGNNDAIALTIAVVRDGADQPWLIDAYHKDISFRLIQACENFILKKSRHRPLPPGVPRYISEQILNAVKSSIVDPHLYGRSNRVEPLSAAQLDVLANAYATMIWDKNIG